MIPEVANNMTNEMVDEMFPKAWKEIKKELEGMSKKELAYEMFGAGTFIALSNIMQLQHQKETKEKQNK